MPKLKRRCRDRLMRYYMFLCDKTCPVLNVSPLQTVTSARIADALEIDHTLVRKDLSTIRVRGLSRVGFDAVQICRAIRKNLGLDREYRAILVGAGHLGGAMLAYSGFGQYGLSIVAAFDRDTKKSGMRVGNHVIRPMKALRPYVLRHTIRLAIIATPAAVAQKTAEKLVSLGIQALWNFTAVNLVVPDHVFVRHEHMSLGLADLAYYLKNGTTKHARH